MEPRFYFATCQVGAEKAVKAEVLAEHPDLRFAFSRPGFITFKDATEGIAIRELSHAIFTRLWGEVIGQTRESATFAELVSRIPQGAIVQCFDRDQYTPGDETEGFTHDAHTVEAMEKFLAVDVRAKLASVTRPKPGDAVWSLIWVDDFHVFLGRHAHCLRLLPTSGNIPALAVPAHSPSRAWLKLEEALLRFNPAIEKGWSALEVGCAPGGATTALLDRGFTVTGIDPQFMDDRVAKNASFTHVRKPARFATDADLAKCNPDWLVMDMSIAPEDALSELGHVVSVLRGLQGKGLKIRAGFLTIKLNDWKYAADIPRYLARLGKIGFEDLHPVQLASNRQEFFVYAGAFRV